MVTAADLGIVEAAHAADSEYILRQYSTRGYQSLSLIAPIAYTGYALARRRPWSIQQTLRATWMGGLGGAVAGAGTGWAWATASSPERVHRVRVKMVYDRSLLRLNDHATIGMLLGAMLTPAIFLKRARVLDLLLGGAGFGTSAGMMVHWWRSITESDPQVPSSPVKPTPVA
ncbi:unnamed protein product [Rhizoctonia solani]|uniref:Uncharacterized protein n=1 Tax=Rhizoctonia solani TaxID=456999 RepID=A0A8H3CE62_9AGAM|nr:hypothetical protein RHS04_07311 [Rhizoctonia solani]CAE6479419.1 unnamed protein product [Rhizoctonia solani]